jgi:hypothetical protein
MTQENKNSLVKEEDEYLHKPGKSNNWRESYYFNWVDLKNEVSGFTTLGILPNKGKRELVFILFYDNKMEVYYREPDTVVADKDFSSLIKDNKLQYKLIDPLDKWMIHYNSRKIEVNIKFNTRFPIHHFGEDSSASWHQHFEASGKIQGSIKLRDGSVIQLNGYGQRDKSWGFRDWHQFDQWFAGHFQFENWSAGFRKDFYSNTYQLSGYISTKKKTIPIEKMQIEVLYDNDKYESPLETIYSFTDKEGNSYKIKATRITPNSYMRFMREFDEGITELFEQMAIMEELSSGEIGSGMFEQLRTKQNK